MRKTIKDAALRKIIMHEEARGNAVEQTQTQWSKMDLVLVMKYPLDRGYVEAIAQNAPVHVFEVSDPHYGAPQYGVTAGREAVAGPAAR